MDPQLSHYTQFYIVLGNLSKKEQITSEQKQFMKGKLMKKDPILCQLLIDNSGPGRELLLRELFLGFLNEYFQPLMSKRSRHKSKTVHFEIKTKNAVFDSKITHLIEEQYHRQQQCLSPARVFDEENKQDDDDRPIQLCASSSLIIEQLEILLIKHVERKGLITMQEKLQLSQVRNLINDVIDEKMEIESFSPLRHRFSSNSSKFAELAEDGVVEDLDYDSSDQDIHPEIIIKEIEDVYHELKKIFTGNLHTHLLLMQEDISYGNIFSVLKYMVKILVDADEYSFFIKRDQEWEIYQTQSDSIQQLQKADQISITGEVIYIKPQYVHQLTNKFCPYPSISELAKTNQFQESYLIKFLTLQSNFEVIFLFHWTDKDKKNLKRKFINKSNEYAFTNMIIQMCTFLVETIITARVQFFSPLKFADQILDIGISFMRISRYLLVNGIKRALKKSFTVEQEQTLSQDDNNQRPRDNSRNVRIEMHDAHPVTLIVKDMDLRKEQQQTIYTFIIRLQERYDSYVKLCHEKSAFYKYFLRTGDSLLFDFNKKGELIFLSRPINNYLMQQFKLNFDPKTILCQKINYQDIFAKNDILTNIEVNIQSLHEHQRNQYFCATDNSSFELFLKVVDEDFKGFAIILHENKEKRIQHEIKQLKFDKENLSNDVQRSIRRQFNMHQNVQFLQNLEKTQKMDVRESMISLFVPESDIAELHQSSSPLRNKDEIGSSPKLSSSRKNTLQVGQIQNIQNSVFEIYAEDDELDLFKFNIFDYETVNEKQRIVYAILHRSQLIQKYQIDQTKLASFLSQLEYKYNRTNNPFHNYDHGISVMQSSHFLILCKKSQKYLNEITKCSTLISALCHDVSHTGRTNLFEINSKSKLATTYHDKSPLEQHHAATTMFILQKPENNFLSNLSKEDFLTFRKLLINNIMYTDIKVHFDLLKDFEVRSKENGQNEAKPFGEGEDDFKLLTGMIVHTADFNGGAKIFEVSRIWSQKVNQEFMAQYIEEGKLSIPQTPFLKDLDKMNVMAKSEMGFFKVIVRPLWQILNTFMDNELQVALNNLDNTIISWEKIYNANLPQDDQKQIST